MWESLAHEWCHGSGWDHTGVRAEWSKKLSPGLALRYTRPWRDLVEDVKLTNEPEQEWLKAVTLLEGKSYFHDHTPHRLASSSQPQPPGGSEKPSLTLEKKSASVSSLCWGRWSFILILKHDCTLYNPKKNVRIWSYCCVSGGRSEVPLEPMWEINFRDELLCPGSDLVTSKQGIILLSSQQPCLLRFLLQEVKSAPPQSFCLVFMLEIKWDL